MRVVRQTADDINNNCPTDGGIMLMLDNWGTPGVLLGYYWGTAGVLWGTSIIKVKKEQVLAILAALVLHLFVHEPVNE